MLAAVAERGHLHLERLDDPIPASGHALVAPYATGLCGSDLHVLARQADVSSEIGPLVLGHEFCAQVLDYGPHTPHTVPVGTVVCSVPFVDGPAGPELTGFSFNFPGACAEQMVLQARRLIPVPDGIHPHLAALTEPLAVGVHAVNQAVIRPGDCCLVLGAGPVGLAVIAALKVAGRGRVIAADFSALRREKAETAGADVIIDPAQTSPYESWLQLAGSLPPVSPLLEAPAPVGRTVAFDCVGQTGLLPQLIAASPTHTRLVVVGVCDQPEILVPLDAITKERSLTFVFAYRPSEFSDALAMLANGDVDAGTWITGVMPLEEAEDPVTAAGRAEAHCKVLIEHRAPIINPL